MLAKGIIIILVMLALFLVWNRKIQGNAETYVPNILAAIPPEVTQSILSKVQSIKEDFVPIETIFNNRQADGSYTSRFMFFNTRHFFGKQFDVRSNVSKDGNVSIIDITDSSKVDPSIGYKGDEYQPWADIDENLDAQFKAALVGYKKDPPQPNLNNLSDAYNSGMIQTKMNLQTRS